MGLRKINYIVHIAERPKTKLNIKLENGYINKGILNCHCTWCDYIKTKRICRINRINKQVAKFLGHKNPPGTLMFTRNQQNMSKKILLLLLVKYKYFIFYEILLVKYC